jgi:WD40 repeat protein
MKPLKLLFLFTLAIVLTACQPAESQPVFSSAVDAAVTPVPLPAAEPKTVATLSGVIWSFAISPDASSIAFATSNGLELYDLKTFAHLRALDTGEDVHSLAWSPDGSKLALGLIKAFEDSGQAVLEIWDTASWKISLQPHFDTNLKMERLLDLAWKPDGTALALSTDFHGVMLLNVLSGKVISHQSHYGSSVLEVAWSPDGTRLVSTGDQYKLRRWKVSTGEAVQLYDQRVGNPWHVSWMPDGKRIVSGQVYGTICFWTVATNKCDGFIQAHRTAIFSLAPSPDGSKLATGGGIIRIWDTHTGKLLAAFGSDEKITYNHLDWASSAQTLASLQTNLDDQSIIIVRLWDVSTGLPVAQFLSGKR